MTIKIDQPIISQEIVKEGVTGNAVPTQELLERPQELEGSTYKIATPLSEHALYITINDLTINPGTESEQQQPFEIFVNSKNMENFAWIVALTRVMSAIFRKGGDVTFLVEELRSVFDPRGGYFKRGGKYMPSLVAEIGECLENHMIKIGYIVKPPDPQGLVEKRKLAKARGLTGNKQCPKCAELSVVRLDGCDTCLSCGYSKCG